MRIGVNKSNDIVAVDNIPEGLTVYEVDADTFNNKDVTLYRFRTGGNWEEITPRYTVHSWQVGKPYKIGDLVAYGGVLYRVYQSHTSQGDWLPNKVPAIYVSTVPAGTIPDWKQPTGAQDAYNKGDKVKFEGKVYESLINANVWSPTVYPAGWREVV